MTAFDILTIIFFIYLLIFINRMFNITIRLFEKNILYKNQKEINDIFENCKKLAYTKVFNEDVSVFSWNGTRVNKKDVDIFSKKFVELVFLYCGESIINDLIFIHGNIESIVAILTSEFITKVISDEIDIFSKNTESFSKGESIEGIMTNRTGIENG